MKTTPMHIIGAFRYALGRQTYITAEMSEWLIQNWKDIDLKTRSIISRDLDEAFRDDDQDRLEGARVCRLGMDMDRREWEKLRDYITEFGEK